LRGTGNEMPVEPLVVGKGVGRQRLLFRRERIEKISCGSGHFIAGAGGRQPGCNCAKQQQ